MVAIVGAVGVEVVPNVRSFNREMRSRLIPEADKLGQDLGASMGRNMRERLSAELRNLPNAKVGLEDSEATRQIADLRAQLDALSRKNANAKVGVNGAAASNADITGLNARLDEFGRKRETAHVSVDSSPASRSIGGLMSALLALAPAAVPVGAAITAGIGATLPVLAAAGAGFGAFGIAVAGSVKLIEADMKSMQQATQKVATAQTAVDNAKGPAARTAAQKRLNTATADYNNLLKAMSPAERTIIKDWGKLVTTFDKWDRSIGLPALAKVAHGLFPLLNQGFKIMTPLVRGTADALVTLEKGANRALNGAFGKRFIKFLEDSAPKAILGLGHAFANIGRGIGGIILAFAPFQKTVLGGLDSVTKKFANWGANLGSSSGFHKFIQYVRENGPQLGKLLRAAGAAVVALVKAAAGFGAGELKTMTTVLSGLVTFANKHPQVAKLAVAVLALAKAVQVLKLATIGGSIVKTLATIGAVKAGGVGALGQVILGKKPTGIAGRAAGGAGAAAAPSGAMVTALGGLSVAIAGALAIKAVDQYFRGHNLTYKNVANKLDRQNPPGLSGLNDVVSATIAFVIGRALPKGVKGKAIGPKLPQAHVPTYGGQALPLKVLISGDAVAAQKLLRVQKLVGGIPKNRDIRIGTPTVANVQAQLSNVERAIHGLPPLARIKVSAPGGNLTALSLLNISRAARNLPPVKRINVSTPGSKGARADINTLAHQMGLLPKGKSIRTSTPGAKAAILDMINLDRRAHGLPPLKRIPTSAPGSDKAIQQYIALARRAGLLPKLKHIDTSTPGAKNAADQLTHLLQRANVLPKGKRIPTDVPGAEKSILTFINLKRKADGLPPLKKIPTSAPGADHSIQQAIDLARRIGLIPKSHSTNVSTPGADQAHKNIQAIIDSIGRIPSRKSVTIDATGNVRIGNTGFGMKADGGLITGPGGPRGDKIPGWLSDREFVQPAHIVAREGVDKMEALRSGRATIVPMQRFADGGIVINMATHGLNKVAGAGTQVEIAAAKAADKKMQQEFASFSSGGGGGNWTPVIVKALALLHQPLGLAALFSRVIAGESGGNPRAINLYDINAKEGHPSVGLAQVIRGTFEAFAGPFRNLGPFMAGVSINPLANIYAGLNYGIQTYGSVANIPGIRSELSGGGYRPYATGGPVPGTGNHDSVPAMLTPGEFVLNKGAVSKVGMGILHAINGGAGTGNGFFHAGGPVLGIRYGAVGEWVKALAIQAGQLKGAFHQSKWDSRVSTDVAGHSPHHLAHIDRFNPIVKRLVAYLWGRHGKATTFDDTLAHFNHGDHPMAFLDIARAYNAGKGFLTEWKGKGKGRHRFIPDSTLQPFQHGLRRYEGLYHHDVQALEHKLKFRPENGQWPAALDGPVSHVVAHALHRSHSQFAPRPWAPLNAGEKTLQQVLKSNAQTAELNRDLNKFISWGLFDLVENLSGGDSGGVSMLPTARAAAKNRGLATKLNAAYKVADRTTGINPLVNLGYSAIKYDRGGYIQPGHVAVNLSGHPEAVLDPKQTRNLEKLASRASGASVNIEKVEVHDGSDVVAFGRRLAFTLANAGM